MEPMIVFPKAFPGGAHTFEGPVDAVYAKSDSGSGWVDSNLVLSRMKKRFLKFSVPVVLFAEDHKSHGTLEVIDLACEKKG